MGDFKEGDRVKFRDRANNEWVGTTFTNEIDGSVVIKYDQGLYVAPKTEVEKVPQSLGHQLVPHDPFEGTRKAIRDFEERTKNRKK